MRAASAVLPAHAGMIRVLPPQERLHTGAPRSRGDDPVAKYRGIAAQTCSPLTRG